MSHTSGEELLEAIRFLPGSYLSGVRLHNYGVKQTMVFTANWALTVVFLADQLYLMLGTSRFGRNRSRINYTTDPSQSVFAAPSWLIKSFRVFTTKWASKNVL